MKFTLPVLAAVILLAATPALADESVGTAMRGSDLPGSDLRQAVPAPTVEVAEAPRFVRPICCRRTTFEVHAAYLHQLEQDVGDGDLSVDRLFTQVRWGREFSRSFSAAISLGYRRDMHDFGGTPLPASGAPAGVEPWGDVNMLSITVPMLIRVNHRWSIRALPTVRTVFEDDADIDKGFAAGIVTGPVYRVNNRLFIGPAIGVISQIEDDPLIFPFVFVDWQISRKLALRTGRGLGATLGLGLFLDYDVNRKLRLSLGGRADTMRFRLDDKGVAPGGVGQHSTLSGIVSATWKISRRLEATLAGGLSVGNELLLEDRNGNRLAKEEYDPAGILGFALRLEL